jgi:primase-polymerase (primpol)-like protein
MRKSNRWVRAKGKRPWSINDTPASTTKPATWSSWPLVQKSDVGDGYGIMLGGGLGCYDFDHLGDDEVRRMVAETVTERIVFAERSISGEGVHVFVEAPEGPGRKHGNIERYTWARFIRMTGVRFPL